MLEFFKYKEELMHKDPHIEFGEVLEKKTVHLQCGPGMNLHVPGKEDDTVPNIEIVKTFWSGLGNRIQ